MAARPQSSRSRSEDSELAAVRAELEASRARREAAGLQAARRELEESRRRLQGDQERPMTYRRPPAPVVEKRRAKAKAGRKARKRARA